MSLFLYFSTPINEDSQGTLKSGSGCWYTRHSWLPSLSSMTSQHSPRFKIKEELASAYHTLTCDWFQYNLAINCLIAGFRPKIWDAKAGFRPKICEEKYMQNPTNRQYFTTQIPQFRRVYTHATSHFTLLSLYNTTHFY